jgi:hypothetical protein
MYVWVYKCVNVREIASAQINHGQTYSSHANEHQKIWELNIVDTGMRTITTAVDVTKNPLQFAYQVCGNFRSQWNVFHHTRQWSGKKWREIIILQ